MSAIPPSTCSRQSSPCARLRGETYSVGEHGRHDRPTRIVAIELADQYRDHGDLYQGDDGVEKWLEVEYQPDALFVQISKSTALTYLPYIYLLFSCLIRRFRVSLMAMFAPPTAFPPTALRNVGS